jgi:hypothetical protein
MANWVKLVTMKVNVLVIATLVNSIAIIILAIALILSRVR